MISNALYRIVVQVACVFLFTNLLYAQPKIEIVEGTKLDFGEVYQGSTLKRDVTVRNGGTDTLIIKEVIASCGCTATLVDKKILAPKESSTMTVTFNSKNFRNFVTKNVTVKSNDPISPQLVLQFSVKIVDILLTDPNVIWYGNVTMDSTYSRTISVKNASSKPVTILSVKDALNQIQTELKQKKLAPNETTELLTTFRAKQKGSIQGTIEIMTDNPHVPKVEVRYFANTK